LSVHEQIKVIVWVAEDKFQRDSGTWTFMRSSSVPGVDSSYSYWMV
jgi:hypothetical protein